MIFINPGLEDMAHKKTLQRIPFNQSCGAGAMTI